MQQDVAHHSNSIESPTVIVARSSELTCRLDGCAQFHKITLVAHNTVQCFKCSTITITYSSYYCKTERSAALVFVLAMLLRDLIGRA